VNINYSQPFSNTWIDHTQEYFKFNIVEEGIYRISRDVLVNSGVNVSGISPRNFQLFCKGEEQYIYVKGETDDIFNSDDYIEFYATKNDGSLDSVMYREQEDQANPYYSLITDTNTYYLTWNSSFTNRRLTIEDDTTFAAHSPALNYCIKPVLEMEVNDFPGGAYANGPYFTGGEGWYGSSFGKSTTSISSKTKTISTPEAYTSGENTYVETALVGSSTYRHHLYFNFLSEEFDTVYYGYNTIKKEFSVSSNSLSSSNNFIFSIIDDSASVTTDYHRLSYIYIKYPHSYNFEGKNKFKFIVPDNTTSNKSYISISNYSGGTSPVLYDLTNHKRINTLDNSGNYDALIPNSTEEKICYIVSESQINNIPELTAVNFTDYSDYGFNSDYIIISHPKLWTQAQTYEMYRNSLAGSGYVTMLVDIEELYNQFSYGIKKHPLAIRNFVDYITSVYDSVPKNLFLLGKAIHCSHFRKDTVNYEKCLVPSFGNPSSDILLTAGINGTSYEPAIPTGRLAANTTTEVENYYLKVVDYENNEVAEWMKNISHFGGGGSANEQAVFADYLTQYESIIEDTLFGGFVTSFYKTSSATMQISQAQAVKERINNGVTLMTFFGHGSSIGFDINIEDPKFFANYRKHPLIIANSCLAGDIHQASEGLSEKWVLIKDLGSIGFLATVDLSYDNSLHLYSTELYKNISYKNYGKPIAKCIQETIKELQINNTYYNYINTYLGFTLHGDPAIVLNSQPKPDLVITPADISFIPQIVTTEIDSFDVQIVVTNIGMAIPDTFIVKITRNLQNNSDTIVEYYKAGCYYKDTIYIRLPVDKINGAGINEICVFLDSEYNIDELKEGNNEACINLNILTSDLIPIFPYEYAIYPNSTVKLKASTGNPFMGTQTSVFQIDTTDTFQNPLYSGTETHTGGVVEWSQVIPLEDTTVYYWRVCKAPADSSSNWRESSFIYINGKVGWSQAHHFQFKKDEYKYIDFNRPDRKFDFITSPKTIHCHNVGSASGLQEWMSVYWELDNAIKARSSCGTPGAMIVAVLDPFYLENWQWDYFDFGHINQPCNQPNIFVFYTDSTSLSNMASMLQSIPNGHYILAYSFRNGNIENWPEELYVAFESLFPSTLVRTTTGNYPYIFFCQKGDISSAKEEIGISSTDVIDFHSKDLPTNYTQGNITSTIVGPTAYWDALHWRHNPSETPDYDSLSLEISGLTSLNLNTEGDSLMTIPPDSLDIDSLHTRIDASQYPYLKLKLFTKDDSLKTPSQLKKWQLTYEGVPETAINPPKGFYFYKDTVPEGDEIVFSIATENISNYDMDSLLVTYWHQDKNNNLYNVITKRLKVHPAGDIIIDTVSFNTRGYPGLNSLWVEFNPVNILTGNYDQLEQYHFNNIAQVFFYVQSDITNPILDVTFDGIHILDGDIVSAKPEILIQLKDENKFLELNDQSLFNIWLKSSEEEEEVLIPFGEILKWTPAQLPDNSCKILYTPELADGIYQLRVGATDISNNESGENDFYITFEIINKATITNIFNYPNPFSTSTRFVFELTGWEIPTDFQILIFTITGKLVKVITLNELGNIHIGRNITDYAWNGKDMYGDQLANGIYFYKVTTKLNGENIEKRDTQTDQYFKHNIGKMYLMR